MNLNFDISAHQIIQFPSILDERGAITVLESITQLPFDIKQVNWLYDLPENFQKEQYVYKPHNEVIVAIAGSIEMVVDDGNSKIRYQLKNSGYGLFLPKMMLRSFDIFSDNSIVLVVSDEFNEDNSAVNF